MTRGQPRQGRPSRVSQAPAVARGQGSIRENARLAEAFKVPTTYGFGMSDDTKIADQNEISLYSVTMAPLQATEPSPAPPQPLEDVLRSQSAPNDAISEVALDALDAAPVEAAGEVIVINEFAWDVYEAAARLSERIKSAAGLALFRDAIMMSEFAPPPEDDEVFHEAFPAPGIRLQWATDDHAEPSASSRTSPARSPGFSHRGDCFRSETGTAPPTSRTAEEGRIDTTTLLPPRVASEETGNDTIATDLLVGPSEMEETWVLLDSLRVRVEMLPGGLLQERDTVFEELNFLLSGLQTWQPGLEHSMPSFLQLSEMVRLSERTRDLESVYLEWAQDADAAPHDEASKQRVCDWLGANGEKDIAIEYIRNAGARRCTGPEEDPGCGCGKWLRTELYKGAMQHCLQCKRPSKRAVAAAANRQLASEEIAGMYSGIGPAVSSTGDIRMPRRRVSFEDRFIGVVEVEARELAFALFLPENNSYYPALVLPSDVDFGREVGEPVMVTWLDGDNNHRLVPATEVILFREPFAEAVRESTVAHWDNRVSALLPGGDAQGEFFFGESDVDIAR